MPRGVQRAQIAIPAQGMIEFRDALTDLLDEFGNADGCREEDKVSSSNYNFTYPSTRVSFTESFSLFILK